MSKNKVKYIQSDQLQELIDWEKILKMYRSAGGHDAQMIGLFKGAELIGHWNEGDWDGRVATCVKLPDGRYVIYNDSYGSCSGCDAWEDASDEAVRRMCILLSNDAYIFEDFSSVEEFLKTKEKNRPWTSWDRGIKKELLKAIDIEKIKKATARK